MFMNINSVQSEDKQQKAKLGILKNKPDIIILAETKTQEEDPEFQIDGYWKVTGISRKAGAGGMLVLAKDTIDILHANAVSVVQEIQVVNFTFNDHLIIGVYRSPTIIGPPINHHKKLIVYLSKLLNKLPPESPFIITGDFNLPELASCNFRPMAKLFDYTEIFDDRKESINQMWADFFVKYDLEQHVEEASRATNKNILDLLITPKTQEVPYLRVDQNMFHNTFDHFPLLFKIETSYTTEETTRTKRLTTPKNLENLRNRILARRLEDHCPTDKAENIANYVNSELKYAYDCEVPIVEVKPPPSRGYTHKETLHFTRQSNNVRYARINKEWSDAQYESIKAKLKLLNKFVKYMSKRDRVQNDIRKFEVSAKKNRNFYAHVKKKTKGKSNKIGPVYDTKGHLRSTKKGMANAFGEHLGEELIQD
jgi:hypothetical protein